MNQANEQSDQQSNEDASPSRGDLPTMLVVDDNEPLRVQLSLAFERRGYAVRFAADTDEALVLARQESPEYAVIDLRMPGDNGLILLEKLIAIDPTTKILVLTGYGSISTAVSAMRLGAVNFLPKPANADDILAAFERADHPEAPSSYDETPSLARVEWEHIHRVLDECGGSLSEAARRLNMHRRTLQRKLRKSAP